MNAECHLKGPWVLASTCRLGLHLVKKNAANGNTLSNSNISLPRALGGFALGGFGLCGFGLGGFGVVSLPASGELQRRHYLQSPATNHSEEGTKTSSSRITRHSKQGPVVQSRPPKLAPVSLTRQVLQMFDPT